MSLAGGKVAAAASARDEALELLHPAIAVSMARAPGSAGDVRVSSFTCPSPR
jgi:hypothetical protein